MTEQPPTSEPTAQPTQPTRRFGWSDLWVAPEADPRSQGGFTGERETLLGYLRDQRLTLRLKCSGLDAAALARRAVEPSDLSLLGLVRHLAAVEHVWFRNRLAGEDEPPPYWTDEQPDGDWSGAVADPAVVAEAWASWEAAVAFADAYVAAQPDLGVVGPYGRALREVLVHLVEEYARHNGHADFLRERIDGRVGQ